MPHIAVVLTTINLPTVIQDYLQNARLYGHKDISFVIIGDQKSPTGCAEFLSGLKSEFPIHYFGPEEQQLWLKDHPDLDKLIPWNSVQRRNLGYLIAAQQGADILIAIDDDNIPLLDYDYFGDHGLVGKTVALPAVKTSDGWFNSCSLLVNEPARSVYHRGYPVCRRFQPQDIGWAQQQDVVRVNVGLWLEDPDVDTITRLEEPFATTGIREAKRKFFLSKGLLAPFNSQNTAFDVKLLPAMFLITLRTTKRGMLKGNNNFRYDDIWMSYFLKLVLDQFGGGVVIGPPHVKQARNPHDFLLDLEKELYPMQLTNRFPELLPVLRSYLEGLSLPNNTAPSIWYRKLANRLFAVSQELGYDRHAQSIFRETARGMRIWLNTLEKMSLS